jgi:hypothetical protein
MRGFRRFEAMTLADNAQMLVFRDRLRNPPAVTTRRRTLSLDHRRRRREDDERRRIATVASLHPLVEPRGRRHRRLRRRKHRGARAQPSSPPVSAAIYPSIRTPPSLRASGRASARDLPPSVEMAIVCVPAPLVSAVVDDCAAAGIRRSSSSRRLRPKPARTAGAPAR